MIDVVILAAAGVVLHAAVGLAVYRATRRVVPVIRKADQAWLDYGEVDEILAATKAAPAPAVVAVETNQEHYERVRGLVGRPVARRPDPIRIARLGGDIEIVYGDPDVIDEAPPRRQQLWLPSPPPDQPRTASGPWRSATGWGYDRDSDDYRRFYT